MSRTNDDDKMNQDLRIFLSQSASEDQRTKAMNDVAGVMMSLYNAFIANGASPDVAYAFSRDMLTMFGSNRG